MNPDNIPNEGGSYESLVLYENSDGRKEEIVKEIIEEGLYINKNI